jgi:hypothetical protein
MIEMESDLREIKDLLSLVDKKLDMLMDRRDALSVMRCSESGLRAFLSDEPDLYTLEDVKD